MNIKKDTRFEFGQNWNLYSKSISDVEVNLAKQGIIKLMPPKMILDGKSFLDIGCGSGIHSIAANILGFRSITATDFDLKSVKTAISNKKSFNSKINIFQDDILNTKIKNKFDIVYSWGVLHHTGNMEKAILNSRELVNDEGYLIIAIYKKTFFCKMWYFIKKLYCNSPYYIQKIFNYVFYTLRLSLYLIKGNKLNNYKKIRGMNLYFDSIDWLGGFPYESASKEEISSIVGKDFHLEKFYDAKPRIGLMGSACSEFVFKKK